MGLSTSLSGSRMKPNPKHPKNQHPLSLQCPIEAPQTTEGGLFPEGRRVQPAAPHPIPIPYNPPDPGDPQTSAPIHFGVSPRGP